MTQQRLAEALEGHQAPQRRVGAIAVHGRAETPLQPRRRGRPRKNVGDGLTVSSEPAVTDSTVVVLTPTLTGTESPVQPRRPGRPPKVKEPESEIVEWWVPGWKDRLRK
jgi:hypothetical protein